jgi:hypothetical protein
MLRRPQAPPPLRYVLFRFTKRTIHAPAPLDRERYANHRSGRVYGVSVRVDCRSFH